jgi:hypothetical protein
MRIAVDVCVGTKGIKLLREAGHEVLDAQASEPDHVWFARALAWGVEVVVSPDNDLRILCYDHSVRYIRVKQKHGRSKGIAAMVLEKIERRHWTRPSQAIIER